MIRRSWMAAGSVEATLELWASSLRDVKGRSRPLFQQARMAQSAGLFLDALLGPERRKTGWMQRDNQDDGAYCLMEECSRTDGSLPHADVPHDHAGTVTIDGIGPGSGGPAMPNTRVWAISPRQTFSRRWRVRSSRSG